MTKKKNPNVLSKVQTFLSNDCQKNRLYDTSVSFFAIKHDQSLLSILDDMEKMGRWTNCSKHTLSDAVCWKKKQWSTFFTHMLIRVLIWSYTVFFFLFLLLFPFFPNACHCNNNFGRYEKFIFKPAILVRYIEECTRVLKMVIILNISVKRT